MLNDLIARIPEGYTPGPWFSDPGAVFSTVRCGADAYNGQAIGDTMESREIFRGIGAPAENHECANAALIALAPELATALRDAQAEIAQLTAERDHQHDNKNQAYEERNRLVALLASIYPSGRKTTDIPGWDPEWHCAVYIDFPWGQASWHYHDSQSHLFSHIPPYDGDWDGHTTEQKYEAIARATLAPKE